MKNWLELAAVFFRLGVFLIGGGYAMLPMLRSEIVQKKAWLTDEELLNTFAIGQSTPGIIAVNVATLVGYRRAGWAGALGATLVMLLPALASILLIASFFDQFQEMTAVQNALRGMRVAVAVLLLITVLQLARSVLRRPLEIGLAAGSLAAVAGLGLSPVPVLLAAAVAGLLYGSVHGESA